MLADHRRVPNLTVLALRSLGALESPAKPSQFQYATFAAPACRVAYA